MNEERFASEREADWRRLAFLCDRADVSPSNLDPDELREFVALYRRVSTDLALARTRSINVELVEFLNSLCGRAYGSLYRSPSKGFRIALRAAAEAAADTVRRRIWFVAASAALFFGSAFFAAGTMRAVPATRSVFLPAEMGTLVEEWKTGRFEERTASESVRMAGFYSSNNPFVSILAGSIAASTFGVGTVALLYANGTLLGALGSEMADAGRLRHLLVSVSPHGVTEISGIVVSGAAGFVMAWALIAPGRRTRAHALREAGRDAIVLLAASVVLMFIAAPIEGFFSFNPTVPDAAKVLVAVGSAVAWALFWSGFGRGAEG